MMCVIIDTCTFHAVFNTASKSHNRYLPVLAWINDKKGKIIIGGSKYQDELRFHKAQGILKEFERSGRLVKMDDKRVDRIAADLKSKVNNKDFDDEHLVALVAISKCKVVCTDDQRAFPYLKRRDLYPPGVTRPRIYRTARNAPLCCPENVVDVCRGTTKI